MTFDKLFHWFLVNIRSNRGVQAVSVVMTLLLVYSIFSFTSLFFMSVSTHQAEKNGHSLAIHPVKLQDISQWHIFGEYHETAAFLPKTGLQLKLEGIFYSSIAGQSQALISAPGQPSKLYRVGDNILGDAKIQEILHDNVVLKRAGKLEVLPLPSPELKFGSEPKSLP